MSASNKRRHSNVSFTQIGLNQSAQEQSEVEQETGKHGLGVAVAALFLAGEMAGSGILALPNSFVGSGWWGLALIFGFTVNACYSGARLGLCWVILEERYEEFRGVIRDPYPSIGEKTFGVFGRVISIVCICFTLYGAGCVFIVLISQLLGSLLSSAGLHLTLCQWMAIVAVCLTPLTWLGSPKDFWWIAVGALLTTATATILVIVQSLLDYRNVAEEIHYPEPTMEGFFKAFASIMFAYAGASTFPTVQADMKQKEKFTISATAACCILFILYLPMAATGYLSYGGLAKSNIVLNLADGPIKIIVEVMLLLHLVAAFPIILNPPNQYFEHIMAISADFNWKRCGFRTVAVLFLLFVAETIPSFGSILDLVGASTVTMLTFVFPPLFYMKLCDASKQNPEWKQWHLPIYERAYCWLLVILGLLGGASATYTSIKNILITDFQYPCYIQDIGNISAISSSH